MLKEDCTLLEFRAAVVAVRLGDGGLYDGAVGGRAGSGF